MTNRTFHIVDQFYWAAWDFAERLAIFANVANENHGVEENPKWMIGIFRQKAQPFMDLSGQDIPAALHISYDTVDTTLREEIFPQTDVLMELWERMADQSKDDGLQETYDTLLHGCAGIIRTIEMAVIPNTSFLQRDLAPKAA